MVISSIFSDGMILQRGKTNVIKGSAKPKESISLQFCNNTCQAVADNDGYWKIEIAPCEAGGPYEMTISGDGETKTIKDIWFGDVYLLGGQSNMELMLSWITDEEADELVTANNEYIRMFQVEKVHRFGSKAELFTSGEWLSVSPKTIGDYSALGYFFAKEKYANDKVPVGLVHTAVGGAPAECLMSEENLVKTYKKIAATKDPGRQCDNNKSMCCLYCYEKMLEEDKDLEHVRKTEEEDLERQNKWHADLDSIDKGMINNWQQEWTTVKEGEDTFTMPSSFLGTVYEKHIGTIWLQKTIELTSEPKEDGLLKLGTLVDFDYSYVNGEFVGNTEYKYPPRRYPVGKNILKQGKNTITIRLGMDNNIGGAVPTMPYELVVGDEHVSLEGEWKLRVGALVDKVEGPTYYIWHPTALFNSMINPLKDMAFDAILYYQGESNGGWPEYYEDMLKALIAEWRELLGAEVPFYMAELPLWGGDGPVYQEDTFKEIREVQRKVAKDEKKVYCIDIFDLGNYYDLHPQRKREAAERFYKTYLLNN